MVEGTSNERVAWNGTHVTVTHLEGDKEDDKCY